MIIFIMKLFRASYYFYTLYSVQLLVIPRTLLSTDFIYPVHKPCLFFIDVEVNCLSILLKMYMCVHEEKFKKTVDSEFYILDEKNK